MIKLNLGSGNDARKSYINVDSNNQFKPDVIADVRKLPFDNNYADEILARDVLEHIPHEECLPTLFEWRRVLKKGGKLIIQTPNISEISYHILEADVPHQLDLIQRIFGGQNFTGNFHNNGFTPETIMHWLNLAGFKEIVISREDLKDKKYPYNMVARCTK